MRVNVYAEEMTERVEIVEKRTADGVFTGVRFYLELPVTVPGTTQHVSGNVEHRVQQIRGPFMHGPDDDDSSAVTFWGKRDLRVALRLALNKLDEHYATRESH